MMHAVVMQQFGGPDVLRETQVPLPTAGPGEVRVKVEAVIVNTMRDVITRTGSGAFSRFVTLPHVLGGEHAGTVDAVGPGVDPELVGKRVAVSAACFCGECDSCSVGAQEDCSSFGLIGVHRQGAYSEFAVAPAANALEMPDDLTAAEGAALLTTGPVGLAQLNAAEVRPGETLVVTGVSGALGSMVAALAKGRGIRVVGLTRDVARARQMPLAVDALIDTLGEDLGQRLREACGAGADAVIDNVSAEVSWAACLEVLKSRGRVVVSGALGAGQVSLDLRRLYLCNQSIVGIRTGNRAAQQAFWQCVVEGFRLPDRLLRTFVLHEAAEVHREVETQAKHGSYVLVPNKAQSESADRSETPAAIA